MPNTTARVPDTASEDKRREDTMLNYNYNYYTDAALAQMYLTARSRSFKECGRERAAWPPIVAADAAAAMARAAAA